jgi:hypothetical protein
MKSPVFAGVLFLLFFIVLCPIASIWAMNTLFPVLRIPYTFETWLAVVIIVGFFRSNINVNKIRSRQ